MASRTSFSMESGFLYPEAVFLVSAKSTMIWYDYVDVFADDVVYYGIGERSFLDGFYSGGS